MIPTFLRSIAMLVLTSLPAAAMAQVYVEEIDLLDVAEVDVLFKCEESAAAADEAVYRLAHRLARHKRRVFSALTADTHSHFGFVRAPYQVSAPAFFERDGRILACVTVQGVGSMLLEDGEEGPAPPTDATLPVDADLEDALDSAPAADENAVLDLPTQASDGASAPTGGYEEEDDLKIPKFDLDGRPLHGPADDSPDVVLDANNVVDRDLFGDDDAPTPGPDPKQDEDAGAPAAADPNTPGLLTDLPGTPTSQSAADGDADSLPAPDATHGPIFIDGQPGPDVDDEVAPGWEAIQN